MPIRLKRYLLLTQRPVSLSKYFSRKITYSEYYNDKDKVSFYRLIATSDSIYRPMNRSVDNG